MKYYSKIISIIHNHRTIIENLSFLSILQVFNLILPLLTYPYLFHVLGKSIYGLVVYAQATMALFAILINYGFNISATRDVSVNRTNNEKLNEIVSVVYIIKTLLLIVCLGLLYFIVSLIPFFNKYFLLYFFTSSILLYETFFPIWFFQGLEKMKYITIINLIAKGSFTVLIFILVKDKNDYLIIPLLNGFGALISSVIACYIIFSVHKIKFFFPNLRLINLTLKESFSFFLSRSISVAVNKMNTFLIGLFLTFTDVAYYDLAIKINDLCKIPTILINQTIYPDIARTKNIKFVLKVIKYNLILSIILWLTIFLFTDKIIMFFGSVGVVKLKYVINLLNLTTIISGISYFLGNTILVVLGHMYEFNISIIYQSILYFVIIGCLYFLNQIGLYQLTLTIVFITFFEMLFRIISIKKLKIVF
ncbi:MAG: oligosaccharide flippase family protein [bacterium]